MTEDRLVCPPSHSPYIPGLPSSLSLLKTLFHLAPLPPHFNSTLLPTHVPQSRPDHRLFQASGANGCLAQSSSGWRGLVRICARTAPPGESGVRDSRDSLATVLLGCQGGVKVPHPIVSLAPIPYPDLQS